MIQYAPQACTRARLMTPGECMLPNPHDAPATLLQHPAYRSIALLISKDLRTPELRVLLWPGGMRRATMLETTVDKHDELLAWKNKIRFAR
jgi:hypothetical protein